MLELELGGKVVTTTDEIQTIKINGNPVEIERVGNSIYVNKQAINLIVIDDKNRWKSLLILAILIPAVAGVLYLAATNQALLIEGGDSVLNFIQDAVKPVVIETIDTVGGYVNGTEEPVSADPSGE